MPTTLRLRFAVVLLSVAPLLFVACTREEKVQLREAKGGKNYGGTYRFNEVQELRTLDPARLNDAPSSHIVHQIYDLLVDFDSTLTLQPALAERWEVSPDGLTYTYHLRKGVRFHDSPAFPDGKGREMKASDVKYSFDRIMDARGGAFGASYFTDKVKGAQEYKTSTDSAMTSGKEPLVSGVSGFRVVDDYTFAIDLLRPLAVFKFYPALGFCYIYPKEAVDKYGKDFSTHPVGTGPFVFDHWTADQELVLKRNPNYWQIDEAGNQLPFLDEIRLIFIKDERQQINEFSQGKLEEAYRIPSEYFRQVVGENGKLTPEYAKFRLDAIPALSAQYYGMLLTSDIFKDKRVRQAFNYAIDRDKIVRFVLQGQAAGPATHGLVPGSMPGYDTGKVKGYTFDLAKARALMAEAGFAGGKGFPEVTVQLNSGGGRNELVAQAIQDMLSTGLGIRVQVKLLEWPQHQELLESGKSSFFRYGWIADYPDPDSFLNLFYGKNVPANPADRSPVNSTRYVNPAFDALFEQALRTIDDAQRMALYVQAEQIVVDDAPVLFIYNDLDYRLVQPHVRGYSSNPMDRRVFKTTWFDFTQKPA